MFFGDGKTVIQAVFKLFSRKEGDMVTLGFSD